MGTQDGKKAEVVASCHMDTSAWNPKNVAFQVLKVKPGTVPVCHFLPRDDLIWIPKYLARNLEKLSLKPQLDNSILYFLTSICDVCALNKCWF